MPIRVRHAFVYPGKNQFGVAFVVTDGRRVTRVAANSLEGSQVEGFLERFAPDVLYYATDKIEALGRPIPIGDALPDALRIVRKGWYERKVPRREDVGKYGNYCYRMAFHTFMQYGSEYLWGDVKFEVLDLAWVEANSPPRILR